MTQASLKQEVGGAKRHVLRNQGGEGFGLKTIQMEWAIAIGFLRLFFAPRAPAW